MDAPVTALLTDPASFVIAVGALGTSAFGLVDTLKATASGGISNAGFSLINDLLLRFFPDQATSSSISVANVFEVTHANWINGTPLADQKAIAKSLIKLQFTPDNIQYFATAVQMPAETLGNLARKLEQNEAFSVTESSDYAKFDFLLTALLDDCYLHADQRYRNRTKLVAMLIAVALALCGGWSLHGSAGYLSSAALWQSLLCGLLATPLAPVSKDLASALTAAVKTMQALRG